MDVSGHPDLVHIGRLLRDRMDRTLEAEMEAARAAARRNRTLREILLAAEDATDRVCLTSSDGAAHHGTITAVGSDHVELTSGPASRILSLAHLVAVEWQR